jgi:hypothetical protein
MAMAKKCWRARVREVYDSVDELRAYDRNYGICSRLGFSDAAELWETNPRIEGSVYPADLRVVNSGVVRQPVKVRVRPEGAAAAYLVTRMPKSMRAVSVRDVVFRVKSRKGDGFKILQVLSDGRWRPVWACNPSFFKVQFQVVT